MAATGAIPQPRQASKTRHCGWQNKVPAIPCAGPFETQTCCKRTTCTGHLPHHERLCIELKELIREEYS